MKSNSSRKLGSTESTSGAGCLRFLIKRPHDTSGIIDLELACSSGKPRSSKSGLGLHFCLLAGDILQPLGVILIGGLAGPEGARGVCSATNARGRDSSVTMSVFQETRNLCHLPGLFNKDAGGTPCANLSQFSINGDNANFNDLEVEAMPS